MACPEQRTAQGWEWQFGVNHVGHFVLGLGLMDLMARADGARLVTLSSIAHRMSGMRFDDMHFARDPYEKWTAYGQSKTAQALFAVGVNARMKDRGVEAFGVHPGGIFTPLQRHLHNKEMAALGWTDETGEPSERAAALFKTMGKRTGKDEGKSKLTGVRVYGLPGLRDRIQIRRQDALDALQSFGPEASDLRLLTQEMADRSR